MDRPKFEYLTMFPDDGWLAAERLNVLGAQWWEAAGQFGGQLLMKRQVN